ncbi:aminotransferase class I/II-fold pyridoxal phosphate-dependent enzyme [Cryptosporangium aurantiacum]|uniref:Transcriptional regulator, GntR family n=1 Tax=Cryptosporangium aurantiacum TaxID=134849 RepID=A0A1M7IUX1_9ACTN|nr:aminotransferase class I/II-fold pyridoxal phosphate-dependent enzyme [Cryptosporangium aurantiacum]SHM44542.1 transcriptional regulator, GntR family [Cryptosporangium aurantiacum]
MPTQYRITGRGADEISEAVERGIRDGGILPGAALPPVRRLATDLGVAATTVAAAYADLRRRGLIETAGRRGTRVRPRPATAPRSVHLRVPPGARDLSHGEPDPELLPPLAPVLSRIDTGPFGYADDPVLPAVREVAARRFAADGVPSDALTLCHGALDAIERCLVIRVRPGDRVAVEDPAWGNVLDLLAALGAEPVGMAVDEQGPLPDAVAAALRRGVSAMVVTSRAHNPTGAAISPARAEELRSLLAGHDLLLIEDDHAAELAGVPLAPLAGATPYWAAVRSVSKPYGPDLRCALLAGDPVTVARVDGRRRLGPGWVSRLTQQIVAQLWQDPAVDAVIARAAATYDARRGALLAALRSAGVAATGRTGLNVWVPVADETAAVATLRDAGIVVAPGARYRVHTGPGVRVTASTLPVADAAGVAEVVAAASATRLSARA